MTKLWKHGEAIHYHEVNKYMNEIHLFQYTIINISRFIAIFRNINKHQTLRLSPNTMHIIKIANLQVHQTLRWAPKSLTIYKVYSAYWMRTFAKVYNSSKPTIFSIYPMFVINQPMVYLLGQKYSHSRQVWHREVDDNPTPTP